jgi:hypothetical protein
MNADLGSNSSEPDGGNIPEFDRDTEENHGKPVTRASFQTEIRIKRYRYASPLWDSDKERPKGLIRET